MTDRHPTTGPVRLPDNPSKVAAGKVHDLADLGLLHKPPTDREYEHAAVDVALRGGTEEEVYAVLAHLTDDQLVALGHSIRWVDSGIAMLLSERGVEHL